MGDIRKRILKVAGKIKEAQMPAPGMAAPPMEMPAGTVGLEGAPAAVPPMGPEMPAGDVEPGMVEEPEVEPEEEKKELEEVTSWLVKWDDKNEAWWIGKVFPEKFKDEAVKFFSQRKSVPKENVDEYLEELKEGKREEMPEELAEAPEIEEEGMMPMPAAGAPAEGAEAQMMAAMPPMPPA